MELAHVIVSMISTRPAKVICKTCRSQHNYKSGLKTDTSKPRTTGPKPERTTVRASEYWEKKLAEAKSHDSKPYRVTDTYAKGDVISHALFGMGVVEDVKSNGKMEVIFRVGDKILVHGMKSA